MDARDGTVLIVGAGLAGSRCAEALRAGGHRGRVIVMGDEPVAPYERPALSKAFLTGRGSPDDLALRQPLHWKANRLELATGAGIASTDASGRPLQPMDPPWHGMRSCSLREPAHAGWTATPFPASTVSGRWRMPLRCVVTCARALAWSSSVPDSSGSRWRRLRARSASRSRSSPRNWECLAGRSVRWWEGCSPIVLAQRACAS